MGKNKYNWSEIQEFYDKGYSWNDTRDKFGVSTGAIAAAVKRGDFVSRNKTEAQKASLKPRQKHSEETKRKMSIVRKQFLKDNPDKVPYLMNHYSKGDSYPEKYFIECLKNTDYEKKFRFGTYELDFAHLENAINLEIDGSQHHLDPKIAEHDVKRNMYMVENGWRVIRVNWSVFASITQEEKNKIINSIIQFTPFECAAISLFGFDKTEWVSLKFLKEPKPIKEPKPRPTKIVWPDPNDLQKLLWEKSTTQIAKDLGVSDKGVELFCRKHNLTKPPRGYWAKLKAGKL